MKIRFSSPLMRRIIALLILLIVSSSVVYAQKKRTTKTRSTNKSGWVRHAVTDEYTTETNYIMYYYKDGLVHAVYFPEDEQLKIIRYYDGLKYFDQTWDAMMDNNGRLPSKTSDVSVRIIRTKTDYDEDEITKTISYTEVDRAGDSFFSYFFIAIEPDILKKAQSISFKWFDYLSYETFKINISLTGFTACYNSATK